MRNLARFEYVSRNLSFGYIQATAMSYVEVRLRLFRKG